MLCEAAERLNRRFGEQIPLTGHMGLAITAYDGHSLRMDAPLAPNLNDKGTAFAGSLATLATLAGWALATLLAENITGDPCEAAVFESDIRYLQDRGRARLALAVSICQDGVAKVRYLGRYAVRPA